MDDNRFDLVTKSLSSGISRRSLLRSLAAGLGVAAIGVERAAAAPGGVNGTKKCYGAGSQCTNAKQCCSGMCLNRVCAPEGECTPGTSEACYSGPAGTAGIGICKAGTRTCDITGHWGSCTGEVLPTTEICGNGLDDDCDGLIDEGCGSSCQVATECPGQDTECQKRTCGAGVCGFSYAPAGTPLVNQTQGDCKFEQCDGAGKVVVSIYDVDIPDDGNECTKDICIGGVPTFPPVDAGTPCGPGGGYSCDGMGQCLPPGACSFGAQRPCYSGPAGTEGVGTCKGGLQTCDPMGMWGPCTGEILPTTEICGNGIDEDCDGLFDEDCGAQCQIDSDCGITTLCVKHVCLSGFCQVSYAYPGAPLAPEYQTVGDCRDLICDGNGNQSWTPNDYDLPMSTACVTYTCSGGNVVKEIAPDGTPCDGGLICAGGVCQ